MSKKVKRKRAGRRIFSFSESLAARLKASGESLALRTPLTFKGRSQDDWRSWRRQFYAAVKKSLGSFPERVPLRSEVLEKKDFPTYVREKVVFDSERFMSVPAWVCTPRSQKGSRKLPAVLCSPGPGPGKDPLVGLDKGQECLEYHKVISVKLAERGYVTIAPDWRGFGERAEGPPPEDFPPYGGNSVNFARQRFGFTLLGLDVWDGMRCIDYLVSRKNVDTGRIACVGVCFGGTLAAFISAFDKRISATCVSGSLGSNSNTALCGGLGEAVEESCTGFLKYGDTADVAGLVAPRPLLVQIGEYDFHVDSTKALKAYRHLSKIYRAAGASDFLELDFFDGGYEINVPPVVKFLDERLKGR